MKEEWVVDVCVWRGLGLTLSRGYVEEQEQEECEKVEILDFVFASVSLG